VLICCIIDLEKNTVCFLTVTQTDLDITMYERESRQLNKILYLIPGLPKEYAQFDPGLLVGPV